MYIKFKFTKKSHVCWEKIIHVFLAPCEHPCERPKNNATRPHAPANAPFSQQTPFTKYLDIHSFNSYTFDREQQKF